MCMRSCVPLPSVWVKGFGVRIVRVLIVVSGRGRYLGGVAKAVEVVLRDPVEPSMGDRAGHWR